MGPQKSLGYYFKPNSTLDREKQKCASKPSCSDLWLACERIDNGGIIQCKCPINDMSTLVDDVGDYFKNSKVGDVFSGKGLAALANFNWKESPVFWVGFVITFIFLVICIRGKSQDDADVQNIKILDINSN